MSFRYSRFLVAAAGFAVLVGCAGGPGKPPQQRDVMLFSPNGEPLTGGPLGQRSCEDAQGGWFDRLAANGQLNRDAFMKDAQAQFARMDLDHDGWITPSELSEYRAPFTPPPPPADRPSSGGMSGGRGPGGGPGGGGPGGPGGGPGGGGSDSGSKSSRSSLTAEDPVMSADTHLLFKVSRDDFMTQANDVFARLDKGRKGSLSRGDVIAPCSVKNTGR